MVRKCASFAFSLLLIIALGLVMAYAHAHKFPDASIRFSAPCEPASPTFKAADQSKAVSRIDSTFHAENGEAPAGVMRRAASERSRGRFRRRRPGPSLPCCIGLRRPTPDPTSQGFALSTRS